MKRIHVAVAIILDSQGECLVSQRSEQQHLAGYWEFPGGKCEPGEAIQQALSREIKEELALTVLAAEPFMVIEHDYPDKQVKLDVWKVTDFSGEPQSCEGQPLKWIHPADMSLEDFPQANREIILALAKA